LNSGGCGGARYELHLRPHRPLSIIQADHQIPTHRTTIVVSATTWKQHKKDKMLEQKGKKYDLTNFFANTPPLGHYI